MNANHCFQVKSSLEDRVITSILGKSSDVAFSITVPESFFCSISFADTLQNTNIFFVLCHIGAYHHVKKVDESLQMTGERFAKECVNA